MASAKELEESKGNKELQRENPDFLPSVYNMTKSKLSKLKKDYDIATMPESLVKDDEGYEVIHKKAMAIVKVRTAIDKKKKELTDDARKWTNKVNAEAKKFIEIVAVIEKPWKDKKAELDKAEEIKLEKEREAEQARTDAIEEKVNNIINVTANLVGANSESLKERLNLINSIVVDATYDEYQSVAIEHKEKAIELLTNAINDREAFEAQQEQMAKDRLEIEEGKAALEKARAEIAALQKAKLIPSPEGDNSKPISHYTAAYATQPADQEDEQPVQEEEFGPTFASRLTRADSYINLTESEAVQAYAENLISVEVPDVGDEKLAAILVTMTENLSKLQKYVQSNTQE